MIAVSYSRLSKDEKKNSLSIEAQQERHKEKAKELDIEIKEFYSDFAKSAKVNDDDVFTNIHQERAFISFRLNNRPDFKSMLIAAKNKKFDTLFIFKWDRFSRNVSFQEGVVLMLRKFGVKIIPTDDSDTPVVRQIMGAINEEEQRKTGERIRNVSFKKFKDGLYPYKAPIGYRKIDGKLKINKRKADMVKEIFRMAKEKINYKEICNKFKIDPKIYYNILRNKVYIGIIKFGDQEAKGKHKPLVDEKDFLGVQK